jgi:predicted DNA-binding antitoxin AbrB/MazE fold protein
MDCRLTPEASETSALTGEAPVPFGFPERGNIMASTASARARVIPAVFEDGVFKPEQALRLKNREHVHIAVLPKTAWARALGALLRGIRARPSDLHANEIETEIGHAAREARRSRRRR